jgi:hypothetical protein
MKEMHDCTPPFDNKLPAPSRTDEHHGNEWTTQDVYDEDSVHSFDMNYAETFPGNEILEIGKYDVLCGRHRAAFNNIGNRRFRITVALVLDRYMSASTRRDKTAVIKSVTMLVQQNGGHFLKFQHGKWMELEQDQAHKKVAHAMRDAAAKTYMPHVKKARGRNNHGTCKNQPMQAMWNSLMNHIVYRSHKTDDFVTINEDDPPSYNPSTDDKLAPIDLSNVEGNHVSLDDQVLSTLLNKS